MRRLGSILWIATFSFSAAAQTDDANALELKGRDALVRGEPKRAMEYFEKAVALQPGDAGSHYRLATAAMAAGADAGMFGAMPLAKEAKRELERAVELDPDLVPARFELVRFHTMAPGMLGGSASAALEQAAEIRRRDAIEGHRAYAVIHAAAKHSDLAHKEYVDMVRENPASGRAHYLLGLDLMLHQKDYELASDELEAAVKLDPSYMPAHFQLGHLAALSAGNLARGEEALRKYLAYRPKDDEPSLARAHYWLGAIHEKLGRKGDAKASYAASLAINPNQKDVAAALKRVS